MAKGTGDLRRHGTTEPLVHGIARRTKLKILFLDVVGHHDPLAQTGILRQELSCVLTNSGVLQNRLTEHVDAGLSTRPRVHPLVKPTAGIVDTKFLDHPLRGFPSFSTVKLSDLVIEFSEYEWAVRTDCQQFAMNRLGNTEPLLDPPFSHSDEMNLIFNDSEVIPAEPRHLLTP